MKLDLRRIKAERVANGYTQDEMAEKLGFNNRASYAKRENGIVPLGADELIKIAEVLGFDENELGYFFMERVPE